MDQDQKLAEQIKQYSELQKENPNIDVAALMMNAIEKQGTNNVSAKMKHWAYLISISLPPIGLFYALYLWFSDKDDARHVAYMCIILTLISIIAAAVLFKIFLSSSGTSLNQIQQIKPSDIYQLTQ